MYNLQLRGATPIFEYLYLCIRNDILTGKLKKNSRLPSKRAMAESCGISVITVENAYSQLLAEGYIRSIEKKGYFIEDISTLPDTQNKKSTSQTQNQIEIHKDVNFTSVENENKFPFSVWSRLMRGVISDYSENFLTRLPSEGVYELRLEISNYLYRSRGLDVSPERIIIGAGTECLCSLLVMLIGRSRIYAFEDPCYKKIPQLYASNGASVRHVSLDNEGVSMNKLNQSGASVLHISPSNHFPTGTITTIRRRHQLLDWLSEDENRYIIEDDFDSELRLEGIQIPSLMSIDPTGRVVFMNTFTKTISPSFRVGYMILPDNLLDKFKNTLDFYSCTVPAFEQYTLARFISEGSFERHINRTRKNIRGIKNKLLKALAINESPDTYTLIPAKTGTILCVAFNCKKSRLQISDELKSFGIDLKFISDYTVETKISDDKTIVVNYSSMTDEAINRLVNAIKYASD